ncbi:MAG: glycerophosphodiester phosphodiesterase family protein [Leifsonia sp.]
MRARTHPIVIGHRGASGYRPEHTASAYRLAFALGADAVEPDIVATRDGVLVLRHENEISGTTDVARRPEFASRRTTKEIDGSRMTGWFTEDFTWDELSTLRAIERLPQVRHASSTFDGRFPILRLSDLFPLIDESAGDLGRPLGMVAEIKHATYFSDLGLPLDELFAAELDGTGWSRDDERLTIEAFELTVLDEFVRRGIGSSRVFLAEATGAPFDQVSAFGARAASYDDYLGQRGLADLVGRIEGISVDKGRLLSTLRDATTGGSTLVDAAHAAGLSVFTWTLRPENRFLAPAHRHGSGKAAYGHWWAEFEAIIGTGVDGVFADHPDLAVEVVAARRV